MPATKLFLTSADIAGLNGICLRSAQYMMRMFRKKGLTVMRGMTSRWQMIDIDTYVAFMCEQDGADPKQRRAYVVDYLKNARK